MKTIVFINGVHLTEYAFKPLLPDSPEENAANNNKADHDKGEKRQNGISAFEMVIAYALKLPGAEKVVLLHRESLSIPKRIMNQINQKVTLISKQKWETVDITATMQTEIEAWQQAQKQQKEQPQNEQPLEQPPEQGEPKTEIPDKAHAFFIFGDTPLLDTALADKMFTNHCRYFASYTFADGYPVGLAPEIIRSDILPQLTKLAQHHAVENNREIMFSLIQKDINSFDIETVLAPKDQRLLRVLLAADTKRNFLLLELFFESFKQTAPALSPINATSMLYTQTDTFETTPEVVKLVDRQPALLRTLPAYFQVQITSACPQACFYCPYPQLEPQLPAKSSCENEMSFEKYQTILNKIKTFTDDAVIALSLWGEPALHTDIEQLIMATAEMPNFKVLLETSGIGWSPETLERCAAHPDTLWILSLDAINPEVYNKLRGGNVKGEENIQSSNNLDAAFKTAEILHKNAPQRFWVQGVRMQENEEELERFYRYWTEKKVQLIIQKYDHFSNFLPDRRVSDISPIKRLPCWHIKRDMVILIDGRVPICKDDLKSRHLLGNIFQQDIEEIWQQGTPYYERHIEQKYPALCEQCDEYYTYNF